MFLYQTKMQIDSVGVEIGKTLGKITPKTTLEEQLKLLQQAYNAAKQGSDFFETKFQRRFGGHLEYRAMENFDIKAQEITSKIDNLKDKLADRHVEWAIYDLKNGNWQKATFNLRQAETYQREDEAESALASLEKLNGKGTLEQLKKIAVELEYYRLAPKVREVVAMNFGLALGSAESGDSAAAKVYLSKAIKIAPMKTEEYTEKVNSALKGSK